MSGIMPNERWKSATVLHARMAEVQKGAMFYMCWETTKLKSLLFWRDGWG